jgi:hypothetical protein
MTYFHYLGSIFSLLKQQNCHLVRWRLQVLGKQFINCLPEEQLFGST